MATTRITTGLRITEIHNQARGARNTDEEWVCLANEGNRQWDIRGWELTDQTETQRRPHIYKFPPTLANGEGWTFDPGQRIFVFTGKGHDAFLPDASPPQFHFYWGRDAFVWNNSGDRVYLRHPDGTFATEPFPVP